MTVTNGYCTRQDILNFIDTDVASGSDSVDDAVIDIAIEAASRYIDVQTKRIYYPQSASSQYFGVVDIDPDGATLWIKDDLVSLTKLTNGDGTEIPTAEVVTVPANRTPKYAIKIKSGSVYAWNLPSDGDEEDIYTVYGVWGYGASVPTDIKQATILLATNIYRRRSGTNETAGAVHVTAAGVVVTPEDIPSLTKDIIKAYRKVI